MTPQPLPVDLESRLIVDTVHARLFGDEQPTRIGKYIILRRIGGGAMADVYLGWHEDLERSDAIKLVHPSAQDSDTDRRRLLREAQALARLTHEHVIRVHDSGTHGDRVYIAMEYVKGTTLGTWQQGRKWPDILDAYLKAGRGLHAAHQVALDDEDRPPVKEPGPHTPAGRRGLVHRDFKPDNVLVGDDGRVRVADFGLAVPVERLSATAVSTSTAPIHPLDVHLTAASALLGTPLYISPEQVQGRPADARSDQFSFCVALYEALYGQHPFYVPGGSTSDSGAPTASRGEDRTAPPHVALFDALQKAPLRSPPRGRIPRRIFDVLARGLERDPARRYPSMAELLANLERDPQRRTRNVFGLVAGFSLVAGLMYAQMQPPAICVDVEREVADLWDDTHRAELRAAFMATRAPYAAASFDTVDRAVTDYLTAWTGSRRQACDSTYVHGTQDRAMHERNMACLDHRRKLVRTAIDELAKVDAQTITGAIDRLRSLPRIEDCDDRLLLIQSCTIEPDDPASKRIRDGLARARAAELSGRYQEAEPLAAAVAQAAATHGVASLAAEAHFIHGRILAELSRPDEARDALLSALDLAEGAGCEGLAAELGTWVAKIVALHDTLDAQLGLDWSRYGFAKLRRIPDEPLRRADALSDRGLLRERREENFSAAEQDYRASLALREQNPTRTIAARAVNHLNLGSVLRAQGRHAEALATLTTSLDLHRAAYGEGHPNLWKPLFNLGAVALDAGMFPEAEVYFDQALTLAASAFGPDNRKVLETHRALMALFNDAGRSDRARDQASVPLAICDEKFPASEPLCLDLRRLLAHSLEILGEPLQSLTLREQILARTPSDAGPRFGEAHVELAASLVQLGRWEPALEHAEAAEKNLDAADPALADAALYHGEALLALGRPIDAIPALERALSFWGDDSADARARATWALARALCDAGQEHGRARTLASEARHAFASETDDPETPQHLADIDIWMTRPCPTTPDNPRCPP